MAASSATRFLDQFFRAPHGGFDLSRSTTFGSGASNYAMPSGGGNSCPLDYLPPIIDVWVRDPATGELIDHVVEGKQIPLVTRVLESLPCPYPMFGDRVGWDIDWGDGTFGGTNGTGPVMVGQQAAFGHLYLDDNPSNTPSDIYHLTVTGYDKDGTGIVPVSLPVINADPTITIDSIIPLDNVIENGQIDETEGFRVLGHVTDPGVLDSHTGSVKADLNWDGDFKDNEEEVSISGGGGYWTFDVTFGSVPDDGLSPGNQTASDALMVTAAITDDDTGAAHDTESALIHNVLPDFDPDIVDISVEVDADGNPTAIVASGSFTDVGDPDAHDVDILWGEYSSAVHLDPGVLDFEVSLPISGEGPIGDYFAVDITVTDDDQGNDNCNTDCLFDDNPIITEIELEEDFEGTSDCEEETCAPPEMPPTPSELDWGDFPVKPAPQDPDARTTTKWHESNYKIKYTGETVKQPTGASPL